MAAPIEGEPSGRGSIRRAPLDANRIPGSAASMKVQERPKPSSTQTLAPSSSKAATAPASLRNRTAIQAMQPFLDSSTTADSPIQPTDIQLLTKSILSNQERQRVILHYQELLIDCKPSLQELKKSLMFLSCSSWGQILEERKLAGKCSYPPCANGSPSRKVDRGKFRINLRNKSVKAVEDLDLGQAGNTYDDVRDCFCSKACYARSEWILRWVLDEKEIGLADGSEGKDGGGRGGGVLGGKWQKLTEHAQGYESIELLEDIERENGIEFGEVDSIELNEVKVHADEASIAAGQARDTKPKAGDKDECDLIGDLNIVERTKAPTSTRTAATHPSAMYDVDVPNTLGNRFTDDASSSTGVEAQDLESDLDARELQLSHILRFASLAPASRPRPRNTTIRLSASTPTSTSTSTRTTDRPVSQLQDEPPLDPDQAKERSEIRRIMDLALDVRRDQREQGLLD